MQNFTIYLTFYGALQDFTASPFDNSEPAPHTLSRRASIKDIIESLGVPHPEVGEIRANGGACDFEYIPETNDRIEVYPPQRPIDLSRPSLLRKDTLNRIRFIIDVNVAKLATLLRAAGFDTAFDQQWHDPRLAEMSDREKRILLTKDIDLLKRKRVTFGYFVRTKYPRQQLHEVMDVFGLHDRQEPFSRCLICNHPLEPIAKEKIMHRLQPLTRKYYDTFHYCRNCDKIYWPGSHRENMMEVLQNRDDTDSVESDA